MPLAAPLICSCGKVTPRGVRCACKAVSDRQRKARSDARRPNATARGYDSRWRRESKEFLALNSRCAHPDCAAYAVLVDHVIPHKGDMRIFWNKANWQGLCAHHHNSAKQRFECSR